MRGPPQILVSTFVVLPVGIDVQPEPHRFQIGLVPSDNTRSRVTLTFAQSIDAKIAGTGGRQLFLSGEESMKMTHWMRTMHDGIFIGVGTAVNDNLQLNGARPVIVSTCITIHPINRSISAVRLLPFPAQNTHFQYYHHPRPIGVGVSPWVISAPPPKIEGFFASEDHGEKLQRWEARRDVLQAASATVILVEPRQYVHPDLPPATSNLPPRAVLRSLREEGIHSVMVEGGARVIQSFLSERLADALIVTTSPVLGREQIPSLEYIQTELFGRDILVALKLLS
ncbi:dihydrofolate reductase-like domain-containing protein [Russula earlei]|uniref:Dihydrofolate reductase-like domain-containing protein n=1 Tax=Russula earlei TaxID=71964 RepID=A0ACC0UHM9_9AGAM|nr:dihydrofolate reductase-like domain-containing protein [Russula earlei]